MSVIRVEPISDTRTGHRLFERHTQGKGVNKWNREGRNIDKRGCVNETGK